MGAFLDKPKTDKVTDKGTGNGLNYGLASMQGWRVEMEDAHSAVTGLPGHLAKWSFFAVFDGHAGYKTSKNCASKLLDTIVDTDDFRKLDPDAVPPLEVVKSGIRDGFLTLDKDMRQNPDVVSGEDKSGSTAVCVLISPSHVFFANCGDSRGILVRSGKVEFSTQDHKPGNEKEKERIQNAGGSVMIQRVNGSLAVSRSLGDYDYKNNVDKELTEQMVSPEPETNAIDRDNKKDEFIVLACDGVWDVMTNEELCNFISHRLRITDDMVTICKEVLDTCFFKGSRDNMSLVLIKLEAAPKPDPDCVKDENALNERLRKMVEQAFTERTTSSYGQNTLSGFDGTNIGDLIDITQIISDISKDIEDKDLPPGGGLAAKRSYIEEIFNKLCEDYNNGVSNSTKVRNSNSNVNGSNINNGTTNFTNKS